MMTTRALLDSVFQVFPLHAAAVAAIVCFLPLLYRRRKRISISYIPGPEKSDPFFGNLTDLYFKEAGEPHLQWQEEYGQVFKLHGLFGEEYLMVSDPKAIQHIYVNSQSFVRPKYSRALLKMLFGPAIGIAEHEDHKRQRKIMLPAFGSPRLRNLFPVFIRHTQKLVQLLKREIAGDSDRQSLQINVYDYATRVTLDLTGDAAFEYQFGALDNKQDKLKEVMRNLEAQSLGNNSKSQIFVSHIAEHLPGVVIDMMPYLPIKKLKYIRQTRDLITSVAGEVMAEKQDDMRKGLEGGRDLMSLLLHANASEDEHRRMSDDEINAGITTIIFAGFTTTASTLTFSLWELAKDPETQRRVRDEVLAAKRDALDSTGTDEIPFNHYEKMPLLNALTKETLRFHPVAFMGVRQAVEDEVIPLSQPLKLPDGRSITEIPVSKGQKIWTNFAGYNRLPSLFGANAHEFNIDRWLDNRMDDLPGSFGVYSNLASFGHGPRACIGWRFGIHEMQTILIELLTNFEFRLPKDYKGVRRTGAATMIPTIPGEREAGTRLDLELSIFQDSNPPCE